MSEQISMVERERKVRVWGKVVEDYRHKANMKRQEIAKRKEWDEKESKSLFGFMGCLGWPASILFVVFIVVSLNNQEAIWPTIAMWFFAIVAFACYCGQRIYVHKDKKSKEEAKLRTDVSKDTLEGDIYLIAKEELRIAEVELAAARQGQEPDPEAIKLNIPFAGQIPKLCKNCAYVDRAELSDATLKCKKRWTDVERSNTCDYFENRRVTTAYMEAKKAFNKFKELDESGFH